LLLNVLLLYLAFCHSTWARPSSFFRQRRRWDGLK